jgi:tRNA G18 (ribose-2'-O)-methylase SpoU
MPHPQFIDDPDDPRLRPYVHLTDPALRRGYEAGQGLFIAEGSLVLDRLIQSRFPVRSVLVTDRAAPRVTELLGRVDTEVFEVSEDLARRITGFHLHRGVLACGARLPLPPFDRVAASSLRPLVLEDIADQTNMGSLFRNAAALGADAVLLSPECCDPLYRRSVRVSMGASLSLPFAYIQPWPEGLRLLSPTHEVLALTPSPDAESIYELGPEPLSSPVALLLGTEGQGLTPAAQAQAARRVRIPMAEGADSLNVATAAAVALSHLRTVFGP